jgi:spermidine synthase
MATAERDDAPASVPLWLVVAFFLSGAAGLVYEVVWAKVLSTTLGSSLFAISTVVSAFFGGLALGAFALGPRLARGARRVERYALVEVGVALLGALSVPALRATEPLFVGLHRLLGPHLAVFIAIRFCVLFAIIVVPTALMGATLPLLVAHAEGRRFGGALSRLYSANTLGAVAGTLAAAFVLIPSLGLVRSAVAAAIANAAAAAIAWARRDAGAATARDRAAGPEGAAPRRPAHATVVALVALSGFGALVLEVTWTRILTLIISSSVLSFAIVLAFYLFGIAAGSAAVARALPRLQNPLLRFADLQVVLGLLVLTHLLLLPLLPDLLFRLVVSPATTLPVALGAQALVAAVLLVPPCFVLGALFPLAARLLHASDPARTTGTTYAVNTVGTIAGAVAAGYFFIPRIGSRGTLVFGALLSLGIGLVALLRARAQTVRVATVAVTATAAAASLLLAAPRWDPRLLTASVYRPLVAHALAAPDADAGAPSLARSVAVDSIAFYREGINTTVSVHAVRETGALVLKIGGKSDASSIEVGTQTLLGLLPMLFAPDSARVAIIGHGTGMTAATVLRAAARSVDMIEIEEAVLEASRLFREPGDVPLDDPRARIVVDDGRMHLAAAREPFDVVVSQPSNPWVAGNNNLFTRDFYRLVRSRLSPGGVFCQWIQMYEVSPETASALLGAFRAEFPGAFVFQTARADLVLVAPGGGARLRIERTRDPEIAAAIATLGVSPPEAIVSYYACPLDELVATLPHAALNTDDNAFVEYRAAIDLFRVGRTEAVAAPGEWLADRVPRSAGVPFLPDVGADATARWRAAGLIAQQRFGDARRVAEGLAALGDRAASDSLARFVDRGEEAARARQVGVEVARLAGSGHADEAERWLRESLAGSPQDDALIFHLGLVCMQSGRRAEADSLFAVVIASGSGAMLAQANNNRGILAMRQGDAEGGIAFFRAAQRSNPALPDSYAYESRALAGVGRTDEARAAVERGLAACPGDASLLARRAQLASR